MSSPPGAGAVSASVIVQALGGPLGSATRTARQPATAKPRPSPGVARSSERNTSSGPPGTRTPPPGHDQRSPRSGKNEVGGAPSRHANSIDAVSKSAPVITATELRTIVDAVRDSAGLVAMNESPNSHSVRASPRSTEYTASPPSQRGSRWNA